MASKKNNNKSNVVVNHNGMRPALVFAHNANNKKAINDEIREVSGVSSADFTAWKRRVNELRSIVWEYVISQWNLTKDNHIMTDAEEATLHAQRERIYPKWKEVLGAGEDEVLVRKLKVGVQDVDYLVSYVQGYMGTTNGTMPKQVSEIAFRKSVETYLGCIIAGNGIMLEDDAEILQTYYSAQNTITTQSDLITALEIDLKGLRLKMKEMEEKGEKNFAAALKVAAIEKNEELTEAKKKKATAEETVKKLATKVAKLEKDIKKAV